MIRFICSRCQKRLKAPDHGAGRNISCPRCGRRLLIPPPVRLVEIEKDGGGTRPLGIPTIADRVAQTVAKMVLEPRVEPIFHPDSYGYRPGRSALDAVGVARKRCWEFDWVIDLDIKAFFDFLILSDSQSAVWNYIQ